MRKSDGKSGGKSNGKYDVLHTFAYISAASAASPAPTQPSMQESTKGGDRRRRPPPFVEAARSADSFMDGCVAVQVEDFGLPKSAVGTVGQTIKIFIILTLDF